MTEEYLPRIYKIPIETKISKIKPIYSDEAGIPCIMFGFNYTLRNIEQKFAQDVGENKKQIYSVTNPFSIQVDDYDDIMTTSKKYFGIDWDINNKFTELWEILSMPELSTLLNGSTISVLSMLDDESSIQSVISFRQKFTKDSKKDTYTSILTSDKDVNKRVEKIIDKFNFTSIKKLLKKNKKYDLVIGQNEKLDENETLKNVLLEIYLMFNIIETGGNFICKFNETYTRASLELIHVISSLFKECYMIKPLTSLPYTSEKYFVGLSFNKNKAIIESLEKIIENKSTIISLFSELTMTEKFMATVTIMNTQIENKQIEIYDKIISFVKSQNYHGDEYEEYRKKQIELTTYWLDNYYNGTYNDINKLNNQSLDKNSNLIKEAEKWFS